MPTFALGEMLAIRVKDADHQDSIPVGSRSVVATERYIHHTLAELAKAAAVLEDGGVFDPDVEPRVGKRIPPVSHPAETTTPDVH